MTHEADIVRAHPVLGRSISLNNGYRCCRCAAYCDGEDSVPLILWSEDGRSAWVYCRRCEGSILGWLLKAHRPQPGPAAVLPLHVKQDGCQ